VNPLRYGVADTFGLVSATSSAYISLLRTALSQRSRHRLFEEPVETDHGGYRFSLDELLANISGLRMQLENRC
jgi:hypothetical protein